MNEKIKCLWAAVFALCLSATGARAEDKPDAWITTKVKSTLALHKNVSALGTKVKTVDGVVTLRGKAGSLAEKDLVESYVKEVEGVHSVDNQIVVKKDGGERGGHARDDERGAGSKAVDGLGDASLTLRVKAALAAHRATSAYHTEVDSDRGEVTLSGTAKTAAERDLAEKVVRDIKGVNSVVNGITVE